MPKASGLQVLDNMERAMDYLRTARTRQEVADHLGCHLRTACRMLKYLLETKRVRTMASVRTVKGVTRLYTLYAANGPRTRFAESVARVAARHRRVQEKLSASS